MNDSADPQWKPIPSLGGIYEVNKDGGVRRIEDRFHPKQRLHHSGYPVISVCQSVYSVHRLVAEAFLGKCPAGMEVNHKNGIRSDARLENLEYITPQENITDARKRNGDNHHFARLTEKQVRSIRQLYKDGATVGQLSAQFETVWHTVYEIVKHRTWKHVDPEGEG